MCCCKECCGANVNWGKWLLAGIVAGIAGLIVGFAVTPLMGTASLYAATAQLWKPMDGHWFLGMAAISLLSAFLLAFAYAVLHKNCSCKCGGKTCDSCAACGVKIAFLIWLVAGFPGMIITWWTMAVPKMIVVEWTLGGLLKMLVMGAVIGVLYKPPALAEAKETKRGR